MFDAKLLPRQWDVFKSTENVNYDIKLYQGGVGSGKTWLGSLIGLSIMAKHPGCTWLTVADTWTRLKKTTWETYLELLDAAKVKHKINQTDKIIKIPGWDNSRVLFSGVEDPLALRSLNGIGAHLEEASMLSEASYLEVMGRLRQNTGGEPVRMVLTTNPPPRKGWLYEHFVTHGGIHELPMRGNTVKISRKRVIARTLDNPYVSDAFIAALESSYDPEMFRIMVLGQDGDYTAGRVCKPFSAVGNVEPIPYRPDWKFYITCDFNVDPMSWHMAYRANDEYHFFDRIWIENTNIIQSVQELARRYRDHKAGIVVTGDFSGKSRDVASETANRTRYNIMHKAMSDEGFSNFSFDPLSVNPGIDTRIELWNSFTCDSKGIRRIKIDPKCKELIYNCENLMYQPGTGVIAQPTPKQIQTDNKRKLDRQDPFDSASYLICRYNPRIKAETKKHDFKTVRFKA